MDDLMNMNVASIANIDLNDVDEVRHIPLPLGFFVFEATGFEIGEVRDVATESGDLRLQDLTVKMRVDNIFEDQQYKSSDYDTFMTVLAPDENGNHPVVGCIDNAWNERFTINLDDEKRKRDTLGQLKAFLGDIGYVGPMALHELDAAIRGIKFVAKIKGRKNAKNAAVYTNIDLNKVQVFEG